MHDERRKNTRLEVELNSTLRFKNGKTIEGKSENISFGGAFINCSPAFEVEINDRTTLILHLGLGSKVVDVKIGSQVVWSSAKGVGVQFRNISLVDYDHFKTMMLFNSPEPDNLLEELDKSPGLAIEKEDY